MDRARHKNLRTMKSKTAPAETVGAVVKEPDNWGISERAG
jgi:hypothetical protein